MAEIFAEYVRDQVIQWHKNNSDEIWEMPSVDSETAWRRLSSAMSPFHNKLYEVSFDFTGNGEIVNGDAEFGMMFRDWATTCRSLPETVDRVISFLESDQKSAAWARGKKTIP